MARESKQKRHEKRFGKAERLADRILNTPAELWQMHHPLIAAGGRDCVRSIQSQIEESPVIVADNVKDYFFENPKIDWVYKEDFPNSAPPFKSFFVEAGRPRRNVMGNTIEVVQEHRTPESFGFLFDYFDANGREYPRSQFGGSLNDFRMASIPEARWFARAIPIFMLNGRLVYTSGLKFFAVKADGLICEDPSFCTVGLDKFGREMLEGLDNEVAQYFMPALLAISFVNCRNTLLEATAPDGSINRERRKAGLKPFLRYHTINIEPMKRVLKTEGNIETEGLKKALHICRGHFATYSEDKPLFGHFTGTVWKPAHVRGSAKQGVVVSDYNVKAPSV